MNDDELGKLKQENEILKERIRHLVNSVLESGCIR